MTGRLKKKYNTIFRKMYPTSLVVRNEIKCLSFSELIQEIEATNTSLLQDKTEEGRAAKTYFCECLQSCKDRVQSRHEGSLQKHLLRKIINIWANIPSSIRENFGDTSQDFFKELRVDHNDVLNNPRTRVVDNTIYNHVL